MNQVGIRFFLLLIHPIHKLSLALCLCASLLLLSACGSTTSAKVEEPIQANFTACQDPRPQICTRDYRPVCAQRDTGVRCVKAPCDEATELKTYSNACSACADEKVLGFFDGGCGDGI